MLDQTHFVFITKAALSKQCKAMTLEWKVAMIKDAENGRRRRSSIVKEFSIASSTLSTVLKNKDSY